MSNFLNVTCLFLQRNSEMFLVDSCVKLSSGLSCNIQVYKYQFTNSDPVIVGVFMHLVNKSNGKTKIKGELILLISNTHVSRA